MSIKEKTGWIKKALQEGNGILRLAPTWVPRSFLMPGGRLKLDTRDLYILGADRGGICERWLASTTKADNGPGTAEDEGLSYIVVGDGTKTKKILLKEAIELAGDRFLGEEAMNKYGDWVVLAKIYDYCGPTPFHAHQNDEYAQKVGRLGKPEAYYFPVQFNFIPNNFPYSFFGLKSGTTKGNIIDCLKRWDKGDNGVLNYSKAYKLKLGTGWDVPAGILHGPGSLATYEVQRASDVHAMFQSMMEGRPVPWDLVVKDVPKEYQQDFGYIVNILDWKGNLDPEFAKNYYCEPIFVEDQKVMEEKGYIEKWVVYKSDYFSAKELTVFPGRSVTIHDEAAYGAIVVQGRGTVGSAEVETPTLIQFEQLTSDEFFITAQAANTLKVTNISRYENLVILKHFGPSNPNLLS